MKEKFLKISDYYLNDIIELTSDLIRIPSFSGEEKEIAEFTIEKLKELNFDDVKIDKVGNVIGKIKGSGKGKTVIFNSHLDTVGIGNEEDWEHLPFSGEIADGAVWGRGASDTKGAFAAQIYAAAVLKKENLLPNGDIIITGVVHEEDSGAGSRTLAKNIDGDFAVVGEATSNQIACGHRGRMRYDIHIKGKSAHASTPELGVNPHFFLSKFINNLTKLKVGEDQFYGKSTIAPTTVYTPEKSTNIIPNEIVVTLDYRNIPSDTPELVEQHLNEVINGIDYEGIKVTVDRFKFNVDCYTGLILEAYQGAPAFAISPEHELVQKSREILEDVYDEKVDIIKWKFATDSDYYFKAGIPTIGFAPTEARYCHTTGDRINIDMLKKGFIGNMALALHLCNL